MFNMKLRALVLLVAPLSVMTSQAVNAEVDCSGVEDMRDRYADATSKITAHSGDKNGPDTDSIDLEDQGCISNYGIEGSFGLPSMADLSGLMDKVCSAADSYISSQADQFASKVTSPLGLADVDLGIGQTDGEMGSIDMEQRDNQVGFDADQFIDDAFNELPDVDSSYSDYSYDGGGDVSDYEYGESNSRSVPEGGRR